MLSMPEVSHNSTQRQYSSTDMGSPSPEPIPILMLMACAPAPVPTAYDPPSPSASGPRAGVVYLEGRERPQAPLLRTSARAFLSSTETLDRNGLGLADAGEVFPVGGNTQAPHAPIRAALIARSTGSVVATDFTGPPSSSSSSA